MSRKLAVAIVAIMLMHPALAFAQGQQAAGNGQDKVSEVFRNAQDAYGPPRPESKCPKPKPGEEIVVCGELEDQEQFRVRTDKQAEDDYARETMYANDPQAPDVAGKGIFRGPATVSSLCVPGLQKCPPPPAIIVDFSALPEAPPGSDADRIARGLPPIGNETGTVPALQPATQQPEGSDNTPPQ